MNKDYIFIDRWNITKADFIPSKNGDTVLISAKSFGPVFFGRYVAVAGDIFRR